MITMLDRVDWSPGELLPGSNWKWFVLRGGLALILGLLAILFPANALFAFTMVFAAYAFVDGVVSLISGVAERGQRQHVWSLILRGVIGIAVGILFVLTPLVTTISYAVASLALVAVWSITIGLFEIIAAFRLRKEVKGEWLFALSSILSVLLGLALPTILILYPAATILSVAWMMGAYFGIVGVLLIAQGFRRRGAPADQGSASSQENGAMPSAA